MIWSTVRWSVVSASVLLAGFGRNAAIATQDSRTAPNATPVATRDEPRQVRGDSAGVAATVERFHTALASGDSTVALSLLTSDVVILESGGIETREEYRAHHLPADIAFAQAVKGERGPMRVSVRGDVAWAWSTSTTTGEFRSRPVNSAGAELVVLTRVGREWKISAIHWSSRTRRAPGT